MIGEGERVFVFMIEVYSERDASMKLLDQGLREERTMHRMGYLIYFKSRSIVRGTGCDLFVLYMIYFFVLYI